MPEKKSIVTPPKAIQTPQGVKVLKEEKSDHPVEKIWNSHSLAISGMGASLFGAILLSFAMAEAMQEKGHVVKISFVFDKRYLHGLIEHTPITTTKKNVYGFDSIEELLKLMEILSSQYAIIDTQNA